MQTPQKLTDVAPELYIIHAWAWVLQHAPDQRTVAYYLFTDALSELAEESEQPYIICLIDPCNIYESSDPGEARRR